MMDRIEAILTEIEHLDRELKGQAREYFDREAGDVVGRILRRMSLRKRSEDKSKL